MSEPRLCETCNTILKVNEVTHCKKCSNRFRNEKPIAKKCVNCGQQFYSFWKRQLQCYDCISEKLARQHVCLYCREPLSKYSNIRFCNNGACELQYSILVKKIIVAFPLDQCDYELLVLSKSGVNYRGLEKLCQQP